MTVDALRPADHAALERTLRATFTAEEAACALSMVGDAEYEWYAAREDGVPRGFLCVGEAAMAEKSFELYWIWVDPDARGRGTAGRLMEHFDALCRSRSMRLATIFTSSTEPYAAARALYERSGFRVAARLEEFYRAGDDLIIYRKDYV